MVFVLIEEKRIQYPTVSGDCFKSSKNPYKLKFKISEHVLKPSNGR